MDVEVGVLDVEVGILDVEVGILDVEVRILDVEVDIFLVPTNSGTICEHIPLHVYEQSLIPKDPGSPKRSVHGLMEPKYKKHFGGDEGHPKPSLSDNIDA